VKYRSLSSSLCCFLNSPFTSSLLGPNILLSTLFSHTLSLRSSLIVRNYVSHQYKTTGKISTSNNTYWKLKVTKHLTSSLKFLHRIFITCPFGQNFLCTSFQITFYVGLLISNAHNEIFCQRSIAAMRAQCVLVPQPSCKAVQSFIPISTPVLKQCVLTLSRVMVICQRDWSNVRWLNF